MRPRTSRPTRPGYRATRQSGSGIAGGTARSVARPSPSLRRRRIVGRDDSMNQFRRFLLVGVGNTIVSFVVYRLLLGVDEPPRPALRRGRRYGQGRRLPGSDSTGDGLHVPGEPSLDVRRAELTCQRTGATSPELTSRRAREADGSNTSIW